jgi:thiosulfate dehydrogenase [quinone] large subunit
MATREEARPRSREWIRWPTWEVAIDHERVNAVPDAIARSIVAPAALLLRLMMGWIFIYAGIDKIVTHFSASGYLLHSTRGPLTFWFHSLGSNQAALHVINPLVISGEILIGATLVLGVFTRGAVFWGSIMLMMFYLSQYPPTTNPFLGYHLVYIVILALLGALGAGRVLGLDRYVERIPWIKQHRAVTFLLG